MSFREFAQRYLEPVAMWTMIAGIVFLCQPWIEFLHVWSVLVMIVGFIGFIVAIHVPAPEQAEEEDETETVFRPPAPGERAGDG